MTGDLVVVGAGGFGREVIDVVRAINAVRSGSWNVIGVIDDSPSELNLSRLSQLGVAYLGSRAALADVPPDTLVSIGVGAPSARISIADDIERLGLRSAQIVHPAAVFGSTFSTGEGLVACAGVSVGTNVTLGRHVHLNPHAVIGHDSVLDDFVSVNPNATVSGDCRIGTAVLIGASAVVLEGREVSDDVVVGAAACVVGPSKPGDVLVGVPARPLRNGVTG